MERVAHERSGINFLLVPPKVSFRSTLWLDVGHLSSGCRRLRQIPGFGPLVSTAMVAAIGNGAAFRRGRDFAAWVGVVPRQYSSGGNQKLFGMSKRANIYPLNCCNQMR